MSSIQEGSTPRTPVYFFSHGGPNLMFETDHPAYATLGKIGKEITSKVQPKAVVVFSAHWQAGQNHIEVNTGEHEPLIYDYYNFPDHYYSVQYPNVGSTELAEKIIKSLGDSGIDARGVKRGLDHGVFVPFRCAFDEKTNPLGVPIVQVSLFDTEDAEQHIKLGRAVEKLRDEGVLIIVSGMAIHNLRDFRKMRMMANSQSRYSSGGSEFAYAASFDAALKDAVEKKPGQERDRAMIELLNRSDAREAHPSFEHLLPIHVGAGAAGPDSGEQIWTLLQGCLGWADFRFGEVAA